jgi:hypothetical protein
MARLEGTIRRSVGVSDEPKPRSTADDPIPAGSTFYETDTGELARFDGTDWRLPAVADEAGSVQAAMLLELRAIRHELGRAPPAVFRAE